ncbi:MAG: hypothetical protein ABIQ02_05105 [Saprospiraceae bacterium]
MEDIKEDMTSMVKVLDNLQKEGYTVQFKATEDGLCSMDTNKTSKPEDVEIKHFYRFEGESSADDSSIVYAIETNRGEKGTLVDSYGIYSDQHVAKFIKEVEEMKK